MRWLRLAWRLIRFLWRLITAVIDTVFGTMLGVANIWEALPPKYRGLILRRMAYRVGDWSNRLAGWANRLYHLSCEFIPPDPEVVGQAAPKEEKGDTQSC